jgi:hypothetical protein
LRLVQRARSLGFEVYTEIVVGRVPETFTVAYPDSLAPGFQHVPCTSHPDYVDFLKSYLAELRSTYGLDGFVLVRDDFAENCTCERCSQKLRGSTHHSLFWDLCLEIYCWAKTELPDVTISVYPYRDCYRSEMDPYLPADLLISGHGSGESVLVRAKATSAPQGDTWLDNVYIGFRTPPAPTMKVLLSDRNAMWTGGALEGNQLTWASVGTFGWDPETTIQSLRFSTCEDFIPDREVRVRALEVLGYYEQLRGWFNHELLPKRWLAASDVERDRWHKRVTSYIERLEGALERLAPTPQWTWRWSLELFALFVRYHMQRLQLLVAEWVIWRSAHDAVREAVTNGEAYDAVSPALQLALLADHQDALVRDFGRTLRNYGGAVYERIAREHYEQGARTQLNRMGFGTDLAYFNPPYPYDAYLVSDTIPRTIVVSSEHTVSVTMCNLSSRPWCRGWDGLVLDGLGTGLSEVELPQERVLFGEHCTFVFSLVAPPEARTYAVKIGMHIPKQRISIYGQSSFMLSVS